jgi:hypothetical protein
MGNIRDHAICCGNKHSVPRVLPLERAKEGKSGCGEKRGGGRKIRKAAIAFILLISLEMILFALLGPLMMKAGIALVSVTMVVLLLGTTGAALWLAWGSRDEESGKRVPRGAILLVLEGLVVICIGFITFFAEIAILPYEMRSAEQFFLFVGQLIIGVALVLAGRVLVAITSESKQFAVPSNILDSLRQIAPEESFETKKFHVFRKDGIYILLKKKLWGVHFIRLFRQTPVSDKKVKAPYTGPWRIWAGSLKDEVNGLHMAKVRREFTIPVATNKLGDKIEAKYVSGPGILYYVSLYPVGRYAVNLNGENLFDRFDIPTIIRILNDLSEEKAVEVFR